MDKGQLQVNFFDEITAEAETMKKRQRFQIHWLVEAKQFLCLICLAIHLER